MSTLKWRFESLDARAGLAFATWRSERLVDSSAAIDDWPCLFFGPPDFTPEPVGNVALALAAARGSFDPGLFIDGREAWFETPEAVAEYVRRAYISSAGGDGADSVGGEGPPTPPTDRENPPPTSRPDQGDSPSGSIHDAAKQFESLSEKNDFGQTSFPKDCWPTTVEGNSVLALTSGALQVMEELLRRMPNVNSPADLLNWHSHLRRFGRSVLKIGLWPMFSSESYQTRLEKIILSNANLNALSDMPYLDRMCLLFWDGPMLDDQDGIADFCQLRGPYPFSGIVKGDNGLAADDPMELLRGLPLPDVARGLVDSDLGFRASLYHALSAFIASPQIVASKPSAIAIIDILLFAAACVTAHGVRPLNAAAYSNWHFRRFRSPTPMHDQVVTMAAKETLSWLAEHFPRLAFATAFERSISSAKSIRYR